MRVLCGLLFLLLAYSVAYSVGEIDYRIEIPDAISSKVKISVFGVSDPGDAVNLRLLSEKSAASYVSLMASRIQLNRDGHVLLEIWVSLRMLGFCREAKYPLSDTCIRLVVGPTKVWYLIIPANTPIEYMEVR